MKTWILFPFCFVLMSKPLFSLDYNCHTIHTGDADVSWNCSDTLYPEFPHQEAVPTGVTVIDLSYNRIIELHRINISCRGYPSCTGCLRGLDLKDNEIESIDKDSFQSLFCLQMLDLSYNRITGKILNEETFQGLHKLRTLSLKGNPLATLPDNSILFTELSDLSRLDVSDCKISTIEKLAFADLSVLEDLDLSGNEIVSFHPEVFRGLHFLHTLDLRRNRLVTLNPESFEPLLVLKSLFLDENVLEVIHPKAFDGLNLLKTLSLANNRLTQIPFLALQPLIGLELFNFSGNYAETISGSKVKDLKIPITTLVIQNTNTLQDIDHGAFSVFYNLKWVYITNNKFLSTIADDAFGSRYLSEVHLDNNGLFRLTEHLLPWQELDVLTLENNHWKCDCKVKWMLDNANFNHSLICRSPDKYKGRDLMTLMPGDLRCPRSLIKIFFGFVFGLIAIGIVVAAILAWKYRRHFRCRRVKGKYVPVYQKDVGDEPAVKIEFEESILPLNQSGDD